MRADEHDLVRPLAAAEVGHDVVRPGVGKGPAPEAQPDRGSRAARGEARDQVGILRGDGGGGNPRDALLVRDRAGVHEAGVERAHRADDRRHRAAPRRLRCALRALVHGLAVTLERAARDHRAIEEDDAALHARRVQRPQPLEAVGHDDLGGDALGRRGNAAAEGGDDEVLRQRAHELGRLLAAHPVRDQDRLQPHVETVGAQALGRPAHRLRGARRAAEPRADAVGQVLRAAPSSARGSPRR